MQKICVQTHTKESTYPVDVVQELVAADDDVVPEPFNWVLMIVCIRGRSCRNPNCSLERLSSICSGHHHQAASGADNNYIGVKCN